MKELVVVGIERIVPNLFESRFGQPRAPLDNLGVRFAVLRHEDAYFGVGLELGRLIQHDVFAVEMRVQRFHVRNLRWRSWILKPFPSWGDEIAGGGLTANHAKHAKR